MPWDLDHPLWYMVEALSYRISDMDVAGVVRYYGYLRKDGEWMIVKEAIGPPYSYRYARGNGDYVASWAGRVALTYYYYNEIY